MRLKIRQSVWICSCALALSLSGQAWAAPDDGEVTAKELAVQAQQVFVNQVDQFDQWMFQGSRDRAGARSRVERRLKLQIAALEHRHQLSDAQKQKLQLAARGDITRLFDEIEELRQQFQEAQNDNNQLGRMWQKIQPLQQRLASGPFGANSVFAKVLEQTLTEEQNAAHEATRRERRAYQYRAVVESAIAMLEDSVPFNEQQRSKLIELLVSKVEPPVAFGQYDYHYVLYRMSEMPEKEFKDLLDERLWEQLQAQMQQMRGLREVLVQAGAIEEDDTGELTDARDN